jgi:hypothetical protein
MSLKAGQHRPYQVSARSSSQREISAWRKV